MHERWLCHPKFTAYEVSNLGRVRRVLGGAGARRGRVLSQFPGSTGYLCVTLHGRFARKVHLLVLETFVGARPRGMEALHRDSNKRNNVLRNLRWGTHAENYADRVKQGGGNAGAKNGMAILTPEIGDRIRKARASGMKMRAIAKHCDVGLTTVFRVLSGKSFV